MAMQPSVPPKGKTRKKEDMSKRKERLHSHETRGEKLAGELNEEAADLAKKRVEAVNLEKRRRAGDHLDLIPPFPTADGEPSAEMLAPLPVPAAVTEKAAILKALGRRGTFLKETRESLRHAEPPRRSIRQQARATGIRCSHAFVAFSENAFEFLARTATMASSVGITAETPGSKDEATTSETASSPSSPISPTPGPVGQQSPSPLPSENESALAATGGSGRRMSIRQQLNTKGEAALFAVGADEEELGRERLKRADDLAQAVREDAPVAVQDLLLPCMDNFQGYLQQVAPVQKPMTPVARRTPTLGRGTTPPLPDVFARSRQAANRVVNEADPGFCDSLPLPRNKGRSSLLCDSDARHEEGIRRMRRRDYEGACKVLEAAWDMMLQELEARQAEEQELAAMQADVAAERKASAAKRAGLSPSSEDMRTPTPSLQSDLPKTASFKSDAHRAASSMSVASSDDDQQGLQGLSPRTQSSRSDLPKTPTVRRQSVTSPGNVNLSYRKIQSLKKQIEEREKEERIHKLALGLDMTLVYARLLQWDKVDQIAGIVLELFGPPNETPELKNKEDEMKWSQLMIRRGVACIFLGEDDRPRGQTYFTDVIKVLPNHRDANRGQRCINFLDSQLDPQDGRSALLEAFSSL